ncbi:MAG: hypothetical protein IH598_14240 [Bacteroidales bacterium]|nr:hypothetical protein [Bacteroidales bacterium]
MKPSLFTIRRLPLKILILILFILVISIGSSLSFASSPTETTRAPFELPAIWEYQTNTDNPHFIIVMLGANPRINDIPILPGDFIGAFYTDNNGQKKCGGADFWLGDANIIFPAFRDDPDTPQKDGFAPAELMTFKIFSWTTEKEYDVSLVAFDPSFATTNKWYPLGLSSIINMAAFTVFDVYATATPNPVCIGDQVTLSAEIFVGTTGNYTYSWTSNPPGLTSNLQTFTHTPTVNTTYFLTATDGTNTSQHSVSVTVNTPPGVSAGNDATICANQTVAVSSAPFNNSGVMWSSSGDGTFNNTSLINPTYTPGPSDKTNGNVVLTVTSLPLSPCTQTASDNLSVTIIPLPSVNLPANLGVCRTQPVIVTAVASNYSTLQWTTNGDGTFTSPTSPTTQYVPGSFDLALGYFTLTCCLNSLSGCTGTACGSTLVTLNTAPTVTSPSSRKRCENVAVQLNSVATNYSSILWITAGDGSFNNPALLNPIYYSGPNDKLNGGTIVTVQAFGNGACITFPATSNTTIILDPLPRLNPGDISVFCKGFPIQLNATAQYYGTISWSTSGNGTFSNTSILNPIYYPGSQDLANNGVNLTLTATALTSCTGSVSAILAVQLVTGTQAQILTPTGQQICVENALSLSATASGYTSLLWTTTGDGAFDDPTTLNPAYLPGPVIDYSGNPIQLKLTAYAPSSCGANAVKTIQITFVPEATVNAGVDATITEPAVFTRTATASHYSSLLWQTSGDGQFSSLNTLSTSYTPGAADKENGSVVLTISAFNMANCSGFIADQVNLTIKRKQTIQLAAGWQGLSSFVIPDNPDFVQVMAPIINQLQIAQNMTQVYWPQYGINTIQEFTGYDGYKIKLSAPATLEITGSDIHPKNLVIPVGWSIMPVLSGCNVSASSIISQLGSNLVIITEIGGNNVIWPEQGIYGIGHFIPGKAYMIKVLQESTITFPSCATP